MTQGWGSLRNHVQRREKPLDLTPGEKAVLGQIRVLYSTGSARNQQMKALMMQWPPTHYEAYKKSYVGLLAKQLIEEAGAQAFRITDAGLKAIGVTIPRPQVQLPGASERRSAPPARTQYANQRQGSALSRWVASLRRRKT